MLAGSFPSDVSMQPEWETLQPSSQSTTCVAGRSADRGCHVALWRARVHGAPGVDGPAGPLMATGPGHRQAFSRQHPAVPFAVTLPWSCEGDQLTFM